MRPSPPTGPERHASGGPGRAGSAEPGSGGACVEAVIIPHRSGGPPCRSGSPPPSGRSPRAPPRLNLLIGAFAAGGAQGERGTPVPGRTLAAQAAAPGARITVTGTGTVSGTPDQLMLSMGVQTDGSSVGAALQRANRAVRAVTGALTRASDPALRHPDLRPVDPAGLHRRTPRYRPGTGPGESIDVTLRTPGPRAPRSVTPVRAGGNATGWTGSR